MSYIHSTKHYRVVGWVGDQISDTVLHLFADADFAGCAATQRSTSGFHLQARGPHTWFPLAGVSKRQSCVSHGTLEAELAAATLALRSSGLPFLPLWEQLAPVTKAGGAVPHEARSNILRG